MATKMGCCDSREGSLGELYKTPGSENSTNCENLSTSYSDALLEDDDRFADDRIKLIVQFTERCQDSRAWTLTMQDEFITVHTAKGSPFNSHMPVAYLKLHFGKTISPKNVLEVISDPQLRVVWDKDVEEMTIIDQLSATDCLVHSIIDFKIFFLHKREFVERHYRGMDGEVARNVYYSIEHPDFPRRPDILRQDLPFSSIKIEAVADDTVLHFVLQFNNPKLTSPSVWSVAIGKLVRWARRLHRVFK
jgi:hypothetical protein